jgi:hypothetical protein
MFEAMQAWCLKRLVDPMEKDATKKKVNMKMDK